MFKDIYKAACDDIKPDPYLIGKIIDNAQPKSRPVFFRFAFSACAAVLALAILIPTFINNPGTDIMKSDINQNTVRTIPKAEIAPAPQAEPEDAPVADSVIPTNPVKTNEAANPKSSSIASEETVTIYSTPYSGSLENVTQAVEESSSVESVHPPIVMSINSISANVGGAGANSRLLTFDAAATQTQFEEIPVSEYFDHIGFSPDKLKLPEGLTADYNSESLVTIEKTDNEVSSDTATFTFSGDSFVSVTTSSNAEDVSAILENENFEKTKIGDASVVVTYDGSVYQGYYITPEGTAVTLTSVDLTEEQFKDLIISATE